MGEYKRKIVGSKVKEKTSRINGGKQEKLLQHEGGQGSGVEKTQIKKK